MAACVLCIRSQLWHISVYCRIFGRHTLTALRCGNAVQMHCQCVPCTASCTACILEWDKNTKTMSINYYRTVLLPGCGWDHFSSQNCRKYVISKLTFKKFSGGIDPRLPYGEGLRVPLPMPSALRRFAPPAPRSGLLVPLAVLPGNEADLWMYCLIWWSGAATVSPAATTTYYVVHDVVL